MMKIREVDNCPIPFTNTGNTKDGTETQLLIYGLVVGQGTAETEHCQKLPPFDIAYNYDWDNKLT